MAGLEPGVLVCDLGSGLPIEFDSEEFGANEKPTSTGSRDFDVDGTAQRPNALFRLLSHVWLFLIRLGLAPVLASGPVSRLAGTIRAKLLGLDRTTRQINPEAGDVVFVADSFWGAPNRLRYFKKLRSKGVKVVFTCFDIIPLTHPEYVHGLNIVGFAKSLRRMLDNSDMVLCISDFTKKELLNLYPELSAPIKVVWLGSDVPSPDTAKSRLAPSRISKSILVLGTVEPRKNYPLILDWFESPAAEPYTLTVVGKPGWQTEHEQRRMRILNEHNESFTWHERATDSELIKLLQEHEIGVQASFVEGFGLPVWEMAQNGMALVLSDIPVFREISPPGPHFFDPTSVLSFSDAISRASKFPQILSSASNTRTSFSRTWDEYAVEVGLSIRELLGN